jgi:hypothetical protein
MKFATPLHGLGWGAAGDAERGEALGEAVQALVVATRRGGGSPSRPASGLGMAAAGAAGAGANLKGHPDAEAGRLVALATEDYDAPTHQRKISSSGWYFDPRSRRFILPPSSGPELVQLSATQLFRTGTPADSDLRWVLRCERAY